MKDKLLPLIELKMKFYLRVISETIYYDYLSIISSVI